jgi:hypothetical protein
VSAKPYSTFNHTLQNSIVPCPHSSLSLSCSVSVSASRSLFVSLFLLLIDLRQCPVQRTPNRRRRITGTSCLCSCSWSIYANVPCNGLQIGGGESRAKQPRGGAPMSHATDSKSHHKTHSENHLRRDLRRITSILCLCSCSWSIYANVPCNGLQIGGGESRAEQQRGGAPMSRATDSKSHRKTHSENHLRKDLQQQRGGGASERQTLQHIQSHSSKLHCPHRSLSLSCSVSMYASCSLFVSLFLLLIDLRQCPVQRIPNRRRIMGTSCLCSWSWLIYANVSCNRL